MKSDEFIEATSRLEKYYEKEYSTEQLKIMFDELNFISIERYKKIISYVIKNNKFLPKIADILEINRNMHFEDKNIKTDDCPICNNTGYVIYTKMIEGSEYSFAAVCDYCGRVNNRLRDGYRIPTAKELNLA